MADYSALGVAFVLGSAVLGAIALVTFIAGAVPRKEEKSEP